MIVSCPTKLSPRIHVLTAFSTSQFSLPVALTANIFSMDKNVIPFLPASFGSFVVLIITFGVLGTVIHFVPSYHAPGWQTVGGLAWRKFRDKRPQFSWITMLQFSRHWLFGNQIRRSDEEKPPEEQTPGSNPVIVAASLI
jgi:hypothetical protein